MAISGVKRLMRALQPHRLIALDTMVFIYQLMDHPRYAPLSSAVLEQVESGALQAVASTLTVAELLTRAAQRGDAQALRDYEALLTRFPHLSLAPLDVGVACQAARLRGASNVSLADAIHVATALEAGAGAIVTNDYAWRAWVDRPKLVLLGNYA
jgi:predicted nucleic acid-binding protein